MWMPRSLNRSEEYEVMNISVNAHAYGGTVIRFADVAEVYPRLWTMEGTKPEIDDSKAAVGRYMKAWA